MMKYCDTPSAGVSDTLTVTAFLSSIEPFTSGVGSVPPNAGKTTFDARTSSDPTSKVALLFVSRYEPVLIVN